MSTPTTVQPSAAAAAFAIVAPVRATHGHRARPWHYRADVGGPPPSSTLCGALPLADCIDVAGTDAFRFERPCTRCVAVVWALARNASS